MENDNVFNDIAQESDVLKSNDQLKVEDNNSNEYESDEIKFDDLSNVAVGQQKKYTRPNLDNKTVVIKSAKLFNANKESDTLISGLTNPDTKYYRTKFLITFDSKNEDGVYDREYMSGVVQYLQKDGSISQPNIWYKGSETQAANLWNLVAKHKGIEPEELDPRTFMNFLNSGIKVKLKFTTVKYNKEKFNKNLISEIL